MCGRRMCRRGWCGGSGCSPWFEVGCGEFGGGARVLRIRIRIVGKGKGGVLESEEDGGVGMMVM